MCEFRMRNIDKPFFGGVNKIDNELYGGTRAKRSKKCARHLRGFHTLVNLANNEHRRRCLCVDVASSRKIIKRVLQEYVEQRMERVQQITVPTWKSVKIAFFRFVILKFLNYN